MNVQQTLTTAMIWQTAQILMEVLIVIVKPDIMEMVHLALVSNCIKL